MAAQVSVVPLLTPAATRTPQVEEDNDPNGRIGGLPKIRNDDAMHTEPDELGGVERRSTPLIREGLGVGRERRLSPNS